MKRILLLVLLLAACIGGYRWVNTSDWLPQPSLEKITIADGNQTVGALLFAAISQGYFEKEGLEVTLQRHSFGKLALDSVLRGEADFATVAETPFVQAVLEGKQPRLVATIGKADRFDAVIARPGLDLKDMSDLKGKKIGLPLWTTAHYFLNMLLHVYGLKKEDIEMINLRPEEIIDALKEGRVDAVSIWESVLSDVVRAFPEPLKKLDGKNLYIFYWNIVSREDYLKTHPETAEKLLRALVRAETWCQKNPQACRDNTAQFIKIHPEDLRALWSRVALQVVMSQSLILTCENQARVLWIGNSGKKMPNFLNYLYDQAIRKVAPQNITLIE